MNLSYEYFQWKKTEKIPRLGLCNTLKSRHLIRYRSTLFYFEPDISEMIELRNNDISCPFWGYGKPYKRNKSGEITNINEIDYKFTPLRETIVLLILAIHGEL